MDWDSATAELTLSRLDEGYPRVFINTKLVDRDLAVRMPDGTVFRASELTSATIVPYSTPILTEERPAGRVRMTVLFDAGDCAALGYMGGSYGFEFENSRLATIRLVADTSGRC